jgi:DNA-binding response OmpR family regulator
VQKKIDSKGDIAMNRILIVEDEAAISNLIKTNLNDAGYHCSCAYDGLEASNMIEKESFDLILLDIMLPKIDGYELIEYINAMGIPAIFLTAKSSVEDIVKGLKLRAEDYLTKPFEIIELLARVENVLRRYNKNARYLEVYDITIDTLSRIVKKNGVIVNLTNKEYELLLMFVQNKNIALFRDRIYERIWGGEDMGASRTVDLHVQRLRKKIELEDKLVAVYKIGYRLEV